MSPLPWVTVRAWDTGQQQGETVRNDWYRQGSFIYLKKKEKKGGWGKGKVHLF